MPPTTIRVTYEPCLDHMSASAGEGTKRLPMEVMQSTECPFEPNTGLTYDERFREISEWETNETKIMRDNGVYDRLVNEEPSAINGPFNTLPAEDKLWKL